MTKLTFEKTEARRLAKVLDPGYADLDSEQKAELEALASAALTEAADIVLERAKFTVVGQLYAGPESRWVARGEADAAKGCLGFFSTAGGAREAAEGLTYNAQTHEEWRSWVLPVFHGSANDFHRERKAAKQAAAAEALVRHKEEQGRLTEAWMQQRAEEIGEWFNGLPAEEQKAVRKRISKAEWLAIEALTERGTAA